MAKTKTITSELDNLKAQLAEARKASSKAVADNIAITRMKAELALLSNPSLQRAKAQMTVKAETLGKLNSLAVACESIVTSMPIHNAKTRENRKWSPSAVYGYGSEIGKLVSILSGIQYSATAHREQMLAYTGLTEALIEETLDSFGSEPYYNKNYMTIVEGKPMHISAFQENIQLVAEILGVTIDTSKVSATTVEANYNRALARANTLASEDQETLKLSGIKLD